MVLKQKNKHFKSLLNELNFHRFNDKLFFRLIRELSFTTLLTPVIYDEYGNGHYFNRLPLTDGTRAIILFTDLEEFNNSEIVNPQCVPVPYFFLKSFEILYDEDISGVIINPDNEDFFIDKNIIKAVKLDFEKIRPIEEYPIPLNGKELKNIFDNVSNESLVEFIDEEESYFKFAFIDFIDAKESPQKFELIMKLHESVLCTVIYYENIEKNSENIYPVQPENGDFATQYDVDGEPWALLLANKDSFYKIIQNAQDKSICYAHLVDIDKFVRYVLSYDMAGIALSNGSATIQIPRSFLLDSMEIIKIMCTNNKLKNSPYYALL